ncbi:MAG: DUF4124 domain-containing protein [Hydrogenophaga sp.]|uniref:DUF4124 domain-containing protein n=1 Tax=Hydrogenophaga sp. TaxID=1904254 RepID=UPI0040355EEC
MLSPLPMPTLSPARIWVTSCALLLSSGGVAHAQSRMYTCVDAKGNTIVRDRPIVECLDREQKQLGNTGIVRNTLPPSYTAEERAKVEAQRKAEEDQRSRVQEERRRERALMIRYPNQQVHDKERAEALAQVDEVIGAVHKRELALVTQRKDINTELEFYQGDVNKAPSWLKRKVEDNEKQMGVQKRFLEEQVQEKQRINARFDEELAKLRQLWLAAGGSRTGLSAAPSR